MAADNVYQLGRKFSSPNAKLFQPRFTDAVTLANDSLDIIKSEHWTCKKYLVERTGYKQLEEFIGYFIRPDEEKLYDWIDKVIKPKFNSLDTRYIYNTLHIYPMSTLRTCGSRYLDTSWTFDDFVTKVNNYWVVQTNKEIPFESDWYSAPPVLEQNNFHCEHHKDTYKGNHTSCPHIKFIRTAQINEDLNPSVIELEGYYNNKMLEEVADLGIELDIDGIDDERFEPMYEDEVFDNEY